ncbi:MAG: 6,7-dimethyl-8-ribityllumazine synthase [Rickettsiales bacterium]|nr:6,7-dimethyl-8-ribityllumazine synthase [Rickettsiales bacterium]|tara:strand:+ start:371 stop:814 length:444 start_codon:yes stop_codon:yes gene_type:complete
MVQKDCLRNILIIFSDYYPEVTKNLLNGAKKILEKKKILHQTIKVDGTLEIPFVLQKYKNKYSGFVILGCVIKGETDHYDIIKNVAIKYIYDLSYKELLPMSCAILTVENYSQALERSKNNKKNLGERSAQVCLNLIDLLYEKESKS